jgi:hypothetical protein
VVSARFGRSGVNLQREVRFFGDEEMSFEGKVLVRVLYAPQAVALFRSVENIDEVRNFKKVAFFLREKGCGFFGRDPGAPAHR